MVRERLDGYRGARARSRGWDYPVLPASLGRVQVGGYDVARGHNVGARSPRF